MDMIRRNMDFIAWENFSEPGIWAAWLGNLALILLFLFVCITISRLLLRTCDGQTFDSTLEEFVFRAALGMSLLAFLDSFLALCGLLNRWACLAGVAALLLSALWIERRFAASHARRFLLQLLTDKWLWLLFIASSLPSLLPPYRYDEMSFHLPYIQHFVQEEGIVTDSSMLHPLYTFNLHFLRAPALMFGSVTFTHLQTWLCGSLCALAIAAVSERMGIKPFFAYLGAVAYFVTPVVQRNLNIAYSDVPLMFFLFMSAYSIFLVRENVRGNRRLLVSAGVICAMFAGIKISGIFFMPLIVFLSTYPSSLKKSIPFLVTFLALGSIWYLRNILIDCDPIPPALNMALGRPDLFWSKADYEAIMADVGIRHEYGWKMTFVLPHLLVTSTADGILKDWPVLGYVLLLPFTAYYVVSHRNKSIVVFFIVALYAAMIWLLTSYTTRYAHFLPLTAIVAGLFLHDTCAYLSRKIFPDRSVLRKLYLLPACFVMLGPGPAALSYYKNNFAVRIPQSADEAADFVTFGNPGVFHLLGSLRDYGLQKGSVIYTFGFDEYKYYFLKEGYRTVGHTTNQYRFADMAASLKKRELETFLSDCGAQAVVFRKGMVSKYGIRAEVEAIVKSGVFSEVIEGPDYFAFIRNTDITGLF